MKHFLNRFAKLDWRQLASLASRSRGGVLTAFLGVSLGVFFLSLVLYPIGGYAASTKAPNSVARPQNGVNGGGAIRIAPLDLPLSQSMPPARSGGERERSANETVRLPGHVLSALKKATLLSPGIDRDGQPLTITLVLKRSDENGFNRYLRDVYDPHSGKFHDFLVPAEVSNRFGPSRKSYEDLSSWLSENGFKLHQRSKNRMTLTASGTRAQVEDTFKLRIADYRLGTETFYANDRDPALPAQLASSVQAVSGLSDLRTTHPAFLDILLYILLAFLAALILLALIFSIINFFSGFNHGASGAANSASSGTGSSGHLINRLRAGNAAIASELAPDSAACRSWAGVDGTGQTIGLLEFDTFQPSDVSDYLALMGSPSGLISHVTSVNLGAAPGTNQDEVLLAIDNILTIAPGAKVVVYEAPFTGPGASFQPVINQMIDDGVTIISNSWNYCEDQTDSADVTSIDALFQTAAASGITVLNASGDSGSSCKDGSPNTVAVPADSPNAIAVGGTSLTLGPGNTYGSETWLNGIAQTPATGQDGFGGTYFGPPGIIRLGCGRADSR